MKNLINKIIYFLQFIIISIFLLLFKLLGLNISRYISGRILSILGPIFRSKIITLNNINQAFPGKDENFKEKILSKMWLTYGKILAEYNFIKNFRTDKFEGLIEIEGQNELDQIKNSNEPVIFISGHFDNFELMAMHIEKSGIDLAAIYRPLNNPFLNPLMENVRKNIYVKSKLKRN